MADQKISELTECTDPQDDDFFPILDTSASQTKKLSFLNTRNHAYAMLSDSTTQTITGATTAAYPVTFNTNEVVHAGISHSTTVNPSQITLNLAGTYLIAWSAIGKSNLANVTLDMWVAIDGTPVPRSNTISRFVGSANERIITVTFIYEFTANQYFELYWASNNSGTILAATGTQTDPTRPACPSVILTCNWISGL